MKKFKSITVFLLSAVLALPLFAFSSIAKAVEDNPSTTSISPNSSSKSSAISSKQDSKEKNSHKQSNSETWGGVLISFDNETKTLTFSPDPAAAPSEQGKLAEIDEPNENDYKELIRNLVGSTEYIEFVNIETGVSTGLAACGLFGGFSNLKAISGILDTTNLENATDFFSSTKKLSTLPNWSFSNVKIANFMFDENAATELPASYSFPKLESASYMFEDSKIFSLPPSFSGRSIKDAEGMFTLSLLEKVPATFVLTSTCKIVSGMFNDCPNLEDIGGLKGWDVSGVTLVNPEEEEDFAGFINMLGGCPKLSDITPISSWVPDRSLNQIFNLPDEFDVYSNMSGFSNMLGVNMDDAGTGEHPTNVQKLRFGDGWKTTDSAAVASIGLPETNPDGSTVTWHSETGKVLTSSELLSGSNWPANVLNQTWTREPQGTKLPATGDTKWYEFLVAGGLASAALSLLVKKETISKV